ncbi:MAG: hypothetical protein Q7S35_03670 [Candidatus Limnocylindrales bacterium]|nr:hypothetical protein [Candidatus Limnocylindrales bacterium]
MDAPHGFELEPVTVGVAGLAVEGRRSSARGRFAMAAWLVVLACVVIAAGAGRLVAPAPESGTAAIVFVLPSPQAPPTPAPTVAPMPDVIVLSSPSEANAVITTRDLFVRGYLKMGSGTVRVTLEARGNRIIDEATIEPVPIPTDAPRLARLPAFHARFGLPNPRPNGRMIVQVVVFGADGSILDVIRRPIRVGPLLKGSDGTGPDRSS